MDLLPLSGVLSAFGLSGAAGLNAYLPLLLVGLLDRFGALHLQDPLSWLSQPWVMVGVAVLGALDFIGDKVPGVDHALHLVGGVVNAAAGALLFASQTHLLEMSPALSLALGFLVAGGVHGARAVARPVATAATGGLGNPVISLIEDATSLVVGALAVFAPLLAAPLLIALLWLGYRVWGQRRRLSRRRL